jgi:hypothetical protein
MWILPCVESFFIFVTVAHDLVMSRSTRDITLFSRGAHSFFIAESGSTGTVKKNSSLCYNKCTSCYYLFPKEPPRNPPPQTFPVLLYLPKLSHPLGCNLSSRLSRFHFCYHGSHTYNIQARVTLRQSLAFNFYRKTRRPNHQTIPSAEPETRPALG